MNIRTIVLTAVVFSSVFFQTAAQAALLAIAETI